MVLVSGIAGPVFGPPKGGSRLVAVLGPDGAPRALPSAPPITGPSVIAGPPAGLPAGQEDQQRPPAAGPPAGPPAEQEDRSRPPAAGPPAGTPAEQEEQTRPPEASAASRGHPSLAIIRRTTLLSVDSPKTGQAVSDKAAHDYLNALRARLPAEGWIDLTEQKHFDWRSYLQHREDFADICGDGIVAFHFHQFQWKDPNTKAGRTDFVALRADGSAVRLHPQTKKNSSGRKEAIPVYGRLEDWLAPPSAPAPSRGAYGYDRTSQADVRGHGEARRFLDKVDAEWAAAGSAGTFARDLDATEWPWPMYMANPCFTLHLAGEKVLAMGIARKNGRPCFVGTTEAEVRFTVMPYAASMNFTQGVKGVAFD